MWVDELDSKVGTKLFKFRTASLCKWMSTSDLMIWIADNTSGEFIVGFNQIIFVEEKDAMMFKLSLC